MRVDDSAFGQLVAAESGRLARLGTLLTGDPARGRALAEEALARALLDWRHVREDEPVSALRRALFAVYGEWWRIRYRRYRVPALEDSTEDDADETGDDTAEDGDAGTADAAGASDGDSAGGPESPAGEYALVGAGVGDAPSTSANGPYAKAMAAAGTAASGSSGAGSESAAAAGGRSAGDAGSAAGNGGSAAAAGGLTGDAGRLWGRRTWRDRDDTGAVVDEPLAGLSHWARAVALLDAEGRSEPEMVGLTGLSERAVARSRPEVPMLELVGALDAADLPLSVERVVRRAAQIRRRRWIGALVALALLAVPGVFALRAATGEPVQIQADRTCPNILPTQVGNSGEDLTQQMVPVQSPKMYLCLFGQDGNRTVARLLDRGFAIDIAAAFNASRKAGETEVCSRETASPFVLRVVDGDRTITLLANPTGCGRVTNGFRTVSAGRDLLTQILSGQVNRNPEPALHSCSDLPLTLQNNGQGLSRRLLGFTGNRIVVCPQGDSGQGSVGELNGVRARDLALAIDEAPTATHLAKGCPSGEHLVVVVTGETERVDLMVDAKSGCGWASNGIRVVELDRATLDAIRAAARLPR